MDPAAGGPGLLVSEVLPDSPADLAEVAGEEVTPGLDRAQGQAELDELTGTERHRPRGPEDERLDRRRLGDDVLDDGIDGIIRVLHPKQLPYFAALLITLLNTARMSMPAEQVSMHLPQPVQKISPWLRGR